MLSPCRVLCLDKISVVLKVVELVKKLGSSLGFKTNHNNYSSLHTKSRFMITAASAAQSSQLQQNEEDTLNRTRNDVSWCVMMSRGVWWCLVGCNDVTWGVMMFRGVWWFTWCVMMSHGVWWCHWRVMMSRGVWWCLVGYDYISWCVLIHVVCDDVTWHMMISPGVWWCHVVYEEFSWKNSCYETLKISR